MDPNAIRALLAQQMQQRQTGQGAMSDAEAQQMQQQAPMPAAPVQQTPQIAQGIGAMQSAPAQGGSPLASALQPMIDAYGTKVAAKKAEQQKNLQALVAEALTSKNTNAALGAIPSALPY